MFSLATSTVLALAVVSCSAGSILEPNFRRHHQQLARTTFTPPAGWATGYLENYTVYHERYLAIDCEAKHNTSFFNFCCHPMLATETLAKNRPACCVPGATAACPSTSSSAAAPAATNSDEDVDCDDGDDEDDGSDQDDGDDQDCTDSDEATSTTKVAAVTSTHHTTSTLTTSTHTSTHTTTTQKTTSTEEEVKATAHTTTTTKATTADTSTKTSSSSSSVSWITGGFGTWFLQNGVAGACGKVHQDTDFVVALPTKAYDNGANCGRTVTIEDVSTGKTATAIVADECPTCTNPECLDMSKGLFETFAALSVGEFDIQYHYD